MLALVPVFLGWNAGLEEIWGVLSLAGSVLYSRSFVNRISFGDNRALSSPFSSFKKPAFARKFQDSLKEEKKEDEVKEI